MEKGFKNDIRRRHLFVQLLLSTTQHGLRTELTMIKMDTSHLTLQGSSKHTPRLACKMTIISQHHLPTPDTFPHAKGTSSQTSCISFQSLGFYISLKYLERAITHAVYSCKYYANLCQQQPGNSTQPRQRLANAEGSLPSGHNTDQSRQGTVPESHLPLDCPF